MASLHVSVPGMLLCHDLMELQILWTLNMAFISHGQLWWVLCPPWNFAPCQNSRTHLIFKDWETGEERESELYHEPPWSVSLLFSIIRNLWKCENLCFWEYPLNWKPFKDIDGVFVCCTPFWSQSLPLWKVRVRKPLAGSHGKGHMTALPRVKGISAWVPFHFDPQRLLNCANVLSNYGKHRTHLHIMPDEKCMLHSVCLPAFFFTH